MNWWKNLPRWFRQDGILLILSILAIVAVIVVFIVEARNKPYIAEATLARKQYEIRLLEEERSQIAAKESSSARDAELKRLDAELEAQRKELAALEAEFGTTLEKLQEGR